MKCGAQGRRAHLALPDADYPPLLRHICAPPPLLYAKGDPGSRRARWSPSSDRGMRRRPGGNSPACWRAIWDAAPSPSRRGWRAASTRAAHQAALPTGTIAVLAGGIDTIYPPENAMLHEAIAESGLLLTKSPPGFAPRGQDFPAPQPHHFRRVVGRRHRRGGTEIRLADHRADGAGAGPRGVRRARSSARSARRRHECADPKRRASCHLRRRHHR